VPAAGRHVVDHNHKSFRIVSPHQRRELRELLRVRGSGAEPILPDLAEAGAVHPRDNLREALAEAIRTPAVSARDIRYGHASQRGDPTLSWEDFKGLDCYVGGDLADKDDLTALVLAAIDKAGRLLVKPRFFLPEAVLDHPDHAEGKGPTPYRTWQKQGHLILTPGDWVDHNEVEKLIRDWIGSLGVRQVTFDQFAAGQAMASRLNEDLASPDAPIAGILHKSAPNVTDPAKDLEARVKAGPKRLRHDGNPVMDWCASNVVVSRRVDGSIIPKKEAPMSRQKIDGIDAAVNAIAPMVKPPAPDDGLEGYLASLKRAA